MQGTAREMKPLTLERWRKVGDHRGHAIDSLVRVSNALGAMAIPWIARRLSGPARGKAPRKISPRSRVTCRAWIDGTTWDEVAERFGVSKARAIAAVSPH